MTPNPELRDRLNELHEQLQRRQPKAGFYTNSIGSILNAYREGDVSFNNAKTYLLEMVKTKNCVEFIVPDLPMKKRIDITIKSDDTLYEALQRAKFALNREFDEIADYEVGFVGDQILSDLPEITVRVNGQKHCYVVFTIKLERMEL